MIDINRLLNISFFTDLDYVFIRISQKPQYTTQLAPLSTDFAAFRSVFKKS